MTLVLTPGASEVMRAASRRAQVRQPRLAWPILPGILLYTPSLLVSVMVVGVSLTSACRPKVMTETSSPTGSEDISLIIDGLISTY